MNLTDHYFTVPNQLVDQHLSQMTGSEAKLIIYYLRRRNEKNSSWGTHQDISDKTGLSFKSISRANRSLKAKNLISIRSGKKSRRPNHATTNLAALQQTAEPVDVHVGQNVPNIGQNDQRTLVKMTNHVGQNDQPRRPIEENPRASEPDGPDLHCWKFTDQQLDCVRQEQGDGLGQERTGIVLAVAQAGHPVPRADIPWEHLDFLVGKAILDLDNGMVSIGPKMRRWLEQNLAGNQARPPPDIFGSLSGQDDKGATLDLREFWQVYKRVVVDTGEMSIVAAANAARRPGNIKAAKGLVDDLAKGGKDAGYLELVLRWACVEMRQRGQRKRDFLKQPTEPWLLARMLSQVEADMKAADEEKLGEPVIR